MSRKENITEEKVKRIAVGATVAGVLLILFLVVILIIQFVQIGVRSSEKKRLEEAIERYEQMVDKGEMTLEWYLEREGLYWTARSYGWI